MLHVVLDTTVLRNDPARKKAAFQSLKRLSQVKAVQVYIPYVVKHEFLSQEEELYQSQVQKIISCVQDLQRRPLPETTAKLLESSIESFKQIKPELSQFSEYELQVWCEVTGAEVLPVHISHGQRVIDSYFQGKSPFKKKKSREDFPDAFIWQAIFDISENLPQIYVVTNDSAVSTALTTQKNIISVRNLDDFIALEACQKIIQKLEFEEARESNKAANLRRVINLLPDNKLSVTYSMESALVKEFQGKVIKSFDIPTHNHKATVDYLGNIEDVDFHIGQVSYYGSSIFVIRFSVKMEALLSYFIDKADYWALDDEKTERMSMNDWSDHLYSVDEDYSLEVEGRMSIMLNSNILEQSKLADEDIIEGIKEAEIRIDVIDKVSVLPYSVPD
jgi:hypothetical protein